jgi:non-homologous end joining protein Ku
MYATAPSPVRSHTTITIAYGMVTFGPLSIYTGTEATGVSRKEFFQGDVTIPVGRSPIRNDTCDTIESHDVVRMAEATNGTWVALTDDEIAACTSPRGMAEIVSFVPVADFGEYLTENVYQVRPKREKGKLNPAVERAFTVLLAGMRKAGVGALIKVAMRGPARYAILTSTGDLLMVYTADAVRQPQPLADLNAMSASDVAMAVKLIEAVGIDSPVIADDTAPVVRAYVDSKAGGAPEAKVTAPAGTNDNFLGALEASIAEATKAKKAKGGKGKAKAS